MPAELGDDLGHEPRPRRARTRPRRSSWAAVGLVALVASPVAVGALSLVGRSWYPVGDWASMLFRIGQVGSGDTPLVGTYTVKGWAHPGPFLYYAATPLDRVTSGDPRAMAWTAAVLNAATIAAIGAVAWRRGRVALTVAVMLVVALLVHGLGPDLLVDLWNPFLGLLPFLLVLLLAWDAALGRTSSVVLAAVPATISIQCHVAFVPLVAVVALWLACWCRWWRVVPGEPSTGALVAVAAPARRWTAWRPAVFGGVAVAAALSLPVLIDLVLDTHNLVSVAKHLAVGAGEQVGLVHGLGLVSRYTRPDGPWMGGPEPSAWGDVQGSGPVVAVLVVGLLAGCLVVARRRGLADVAALATLALTLVVAAVPASANLVTPVFPYLTQWLKIVGGFVWFTVAWTAWRLVEPRVTVAGARRVVGAAAIAGVVGATVWTYGPATDVELAAETEGAVVQDLRGQLVDRLDRELTYRVEGVADSFGHNAAGVIYYLIADGYDVLTTDGAAGLKWGHTHRWARGDRVDARLTVAVHYAGSWRDAYRECRQDPDVQLVASYDGLDASERARREELRQEAFTSPGSVTEADRAEARRLEADGFRVGVFAGDTGCATRDPRARQGD